MNKKYISFILAALVGLFAQAQVSITNIGTPYTQDFNSLANTGTTNTALPTGWLFSEAGTGANTTYGADNGATTAGNTYSYGSTGNTERAFGSLQSGNVAPTLGVGFVNNTGVPITTLTINYTGEQWRVGVASRTIADTLNFQYSTDATSLTTGTWVDENNLDLASPTLNVAAGAVDGNAAANRTAKSFTIVGLNIADGASFYLRWADYNIASSDDGLSIDDITITFNGTIDPPCAEPTAQATSLSIGSATASSLTVGFTLAVPAADEYLVVRSTSPTLSGNPVDGVNYTIGQALGGGTVVSYGTINNFIDGGLAANTTYYYFVFSANSQDCTGGPNYLVTAPATGSNTTFALSPCLPPLIGPQNLVLTPGSISVSGSFTASPANRHLVVRSLSPTLSANPVNGVTYLPGQSLGGGTVVSFISGITAGFFASGLNPNTTYYFFIFAAKGDCAGEPLYLTTDIATGNTTTTNGSGGIPPAYYDAAGGLTCQPLKTALKNIISTGTQTLSYTPGVWNIYYYSDVRRNDANTANIVWDMYTDLPTGSTYYNGTPEIQFTLGSDQCGNYSNEGDCYNREHSFPQSWFNSASPMVSDVHHLFATDGKVNGIRGNLPYGEVNKAITGGQYYKSKNESYRGTPVATLGYGGTVFEPRDEYKGDFARAQLYMAVRYEDQINGWSGNGNANDVLLSSSDEPDAAKRKLQVYDDWHIRLLFKWHSQDPVSQKEIDRNNAIYYQEVTDGGSPRRQGNRNPFVDHPEYAALIWQCSNAIPVTLIDFKASKNSDNIVLQWQATRESNFKQYEIERSSNGIDFVVIGTINGQNLSNYHFIDNQLPSVKAVYYRLKLVDVDGKFNYSKTVAIRLNGFSGAFTYPNPTTGQLTVQLQNPLAEKSVLAISDVTGRIIKQLNIPARQATIQVDASTLPVGRYFIKIVGQETIINQTFNVVR
jgi:endonuclease I